MMSEIGNACPARVKAQEYDDGQDHVVGKHEPVMHGLIDRRFLIPVDPHVTASEVVLKVCKNCGSVYAERP